MITDIYILSSNWVECYIWSNIRISTLNLSKLNHWFNLLIECIIYKQIITMLQNKIYQSFLLEILKNFSVVLIGLSLVAYDKSCCFRVNCWKWISSPVYFRICILNLFGIIPKFVLLLFCILIYFNGKHLQDNDFIILWTAVRK